MYNALFLIITLLLLTGCGRAIHHNDDIRVDTISNHKVTDIIGKWRVVYVDYKMSNKYFSTKERFGMNFPDYEGYTLGITKHNLSRGNKVWSIDFRENNKLNLVETTLRNRSVYERIWYGSYTCDGDNIKISGKNLHFVDRTIAGEGTYIRKDIMLYIHFPNRHLTLRSHH